MRACAVVPSYNHHRAVPTIVATLRAAGLAVFVIDDGSAAETAAALARLHAPQDEVSVVRLPVNGGKGTAVLEGFRQAEAAGFTHAVQVDADGQHDLGALPALLDLARQHPEALISARPLYDASVPAARRIGRWLTHAWVLVETLSLAIRDSMCGFRVYPLAPVAALVASEPIGRRMDFDTDIMVRLYWRGVDVKQHPVRVVYPPGNTSSFDMLRDNARISAMHARLVAGMLRRLPRLLTGHGGSARPTTHWSALQERGVYWGLRCIALAWRLLGRTGCLIVAAPAILYFYASGREQRRASRDFLRRAFAAAGRPRQPTHRDGLRHFASFAGRALDTFVAWTGAVKLADIRDADPAVRQAMENDPRGGVLIVSHHGNVDLSRAALDPRTRARLTVLVHTRHAANYNRVLAELNPQAALNTVQVSEIGPETAIRLQEQVDAGQWLVIAGDRTPVASQGSTARVPFLGAAAPLPHGPFILAALMRCPVWLLFCRREGSGYMLRFERFAERIELPRGRRTEVLDACCARYAQRLGAEARDAPFQWYNFYDFWAER